MKLPCENAIWYTLPRIRADIAKELVKGGMSQREVAQKLGLTPAAVSQYLNRKRGGNLRMPKEYKTLIKGASSEIMESGDSQVISRILCRCCACSRPK
ncbi:MAG: helix-turn-helix domain-containing protein [Candidatus Altiarchaeota archaeon]